MAAAKNTPFTCCTPVRHNGKRYAPGESLSLSPSQAEPLLALSAISPVEAAKAAGT